jgi:hypothetical protein
MEFEKLSLEVSAAKAGLSAVNPHVLQGSSGVEHRFDLLFTDGSLNYAFDFYESLTEVEVLKSYAKKVDSECSVNIICPAGKAAKEAKKLAHSYNMRVITPESALAFFALEGVEPASSSG